MSETTIASSHRANYYRDAFGHAPDGYYSINREGIIIECNETWAEMLGFSKDEIIGRPSIDLLSPVSQKKARALIPVFFQLGEIHRAAFQYVRRDGTLLNASLSATLADSHSGAAYSRAIVRDVFEPEAPNSTLSVDLDVGVFIIEQDDLLRRQLLNLVARSQGVAFVGEAPTPEAALDQISTPGPDLVLVNSSIVHAKRQVLASLAEQYPESHFVLFGSKADVDAFLLAASWHLRGALSLSDITTSDFRASLEKIAAGGGVIEPYTARELIERLPDLVNGIRRPQRQHEPLSQREREVLSAIRDGLTNKEIAVRLGVRPGTIRTHIRSIFAKLEVTSRTAAVVAAFG